MKKLLLLFILIPCLGFSQVQIGHNINGEQGETLSDYGSSVSSSDKGDIIAIGGPLYNGNGIQSGYVQVFENINGIWTQIGSDINGEAGEDQSGYSVNLSSDGSILAIGAPENDGNGENSGHVRVYANVGGIWTQIGSDIDGEAAEDEFGFSVSLSSNGNILAVGARLNDGNGTNSGSVRVYENIESVWKQIGNDIDGEMAGDQSGFDISLSSNGDTVAIGAPINDGNGIISGHVRIYENTGGSWTQIGQDIDGEEIRDRSGSSVSLSSDGSIVAIGAPRNDGNGAFSGHVRVYQNVEGFWTQVGQDIDGVDSIDFFGESVILSSDGSIVAAGASGNDENGSGSGQLRVYQNVEGFWTQINNVIGGEAIDDQSGGSVSLSSDGNIVVIGATGNDGNGYNSGQARVFKNEFGVWSQLGDDIDGRITYSADQFGHSTSISSNGNIIAVAANRKDNGIDNIRGGQVTIYEINNGDWTQVGNRINGESSFDDSGSSVSLSSDGNIIAIGAIFNDGNGDRSGHVRIYQNIGGSWTQIGNDIDGEAASNLSGSSISLSSDGSILAISAIANSANGLNSGHVRIYQNIGGSWIQIGNDIDGENMSDQFGNSVSLSSDGSTVAIGSLIHDSDRGQVRIFENINSTWTQIGNTINGDNLGDRLGFSVNLSANGRIVALGAKISDGNNPELVRIYEIVNDSWTQVGNDISGGTVSDFFGGNLSLSPQGDLIVVGPSRNSGGIANASKVKMYKNLEDSWIQVGNDIDEFIVNNINNTGDLKTLSLALSANGNLVIGLPGNDFNGINSGQVRVYSFASEIAVLEVLEDITGNNNGINVTAEQLNAIEGVSGAMDGVNYTTALQNGTFVDPNNPSASEIQAIIDQVNATLSVNDINTFEFQLYPNPTKNKFTIQLENSVKLENVNIYNNLGQSVLTTKKNIVDISKLSSDLYVVEIETNKGKATKKLIIE